ncbi:hypothetical protein [Bradyrhizobium sp. Mp19]|nr:hypothetical protein [Bradyrhizobium sp. Mp19]MDI2052690.1 hypothetical protein [Bradyrhizobium sp. Mp19]
MLTPLLVYGIPLDFILFALTLLGSRIVAMSFCEPRSCQTYLSS